MTADPVADDDAIAEKPANPDLDARMVSVVVAVSSPPNPAPCVELEYTPDDVGAYTAKFGPALLMRMLAALNPNATDTAAAVVAVIVVA